MTVKKETVIDMTDDAQANQPVAAQPVIDETGAGAPAIIDEDGEANPLPKGAIRNENGSVTLTLRKPIPLQIRSAKGTRTEEYKELTFHRLMGADIRAISAASKESQDVVALARSTRMREPIMNGLFNEMDAADISRAGDVLTYFLENGPKTGR